jgi:hypothetical protein
MVTQPRRYLVGLEDALRVAKKFVRTGGFAQDEHWESPGP